MKKPQLKVGQHWVLPDGMIVRVIGWGQDGGGQGIVRYTDVGEPNSQYSQFGKGFREEATPVLEAR